MRTVKWSLAYDLDNNEVNIQDAVPGAKYFCIACGSPMMVRKSDRKAHHFAHIRTPDNYSYESELHLFCKKILFNYLRTLHYENQPLNIGKKCCKCGRPIKFDLLSDITCVTSEASFNLGGKIVRPDIALVQEDILKYVVEIVVMHPPEDGTVNAYNSSHVIMLEIEPTELVEISAITMLRSVIIWKDECQICREETIRKAQIEAEKERRRKDFYDWEEPIKQLLTMAKTQGYAILPQHLWRLFKKAQPLLTRKDSYLLILDAKKQARMFFIDIGDERIFIDQYDLFSSECVFNAGKYDMHLFFRTYNKEFSYSVCIVCEEWAVKKVAVKSYASWRQQKYYQDYIEDTFGECDSNMGVDQILKKLFIT